MLCGVGEAHTSRLTHPTSCFCAFPGEVLEASVLWGHGVWHIADEASVESQ